MNAELLARLSDVYGIQKLKARYCEIADAIPQVAASAATVRFCEVFAEDVDADYGLGFLRGRSAVVDFLVTRVSAGQSWMWHSIHSPQVEVQGDTAIGSWTLLAHMKSSGKPQLQTLIGRYLDQLRRTPEGWRIRSIRFNAELIRTERFESDSADFVFSHSL